MAEEIKAKFTADNSDFNRKTDEVQAKSKGLGNAMGKLGKLFAGAFAFGTIIAGFKKFIGMSSEFQQSLANLSAITGATGEDLKFYGEQARQMGKTTTLSANEAVKAFELMGSARPELLKNKEALAAVTKEAVILAEASGMDLTTATLSLAKAMNQFNVPANEASRVINVLAAGSKEGAEAVPGISDAIVNMGTAASLANITLEESVGMIETLAEKGIDGARSGTQLRNVILKLQKGADQFNPKIVGMKTALDNLSNANMSAAEIMEIFGLENAQAGMILMENRDKFQKYTEAVTGTNVAYEQQQARVDTLQSAWKIFTNTLAAAFTGGSKVTDWLKDAVQWMTKLINNFDKVKAPIVDVINYFIDLYNESTAVRIAVESVKLVIRTAFDSLKMQAKLIVNAFVGVGKVLKDVFTGNWGEIKDHAKEAFGAMKDDAVDFAMDVADNWDKLRKNMEERPKIELISKDTVAEVDAVTAAVDNLGSSLERAAGSMDKFGLTKLAPVAGEGTINIAPKVDPTALIEISTAVGTIGEVYDYAQQAAMAFGSEVVASSMQGIKSAKDFARVAVDASKKIISGYLAEAVAAQVKAWAGTGVLGLIGAGVAAGATVALFNAVIPSFAEGGGVSGPTYALVGEAPGISRSNPEYIGTAKQLAQMGVGGGGGQLTCRVSKDSLLFILNEGSAANNRNY